MRDRRRRPIQKEGRKFIIYKGRTGDGLWINNQAEVLTGEIMARTQPRQL